MADKVLLKPRKEFIVRNPATLEPLPPDGAEVALTAYWRRRLRDGDVSEVKQPRATARKVEKEEA